MKSDYEITIIFSPNHEMIQTLANKTEKEAMDHVSAIMAKYPDASVLIEKED